MRAQIHDLHYAVRALKSRPGFAAVIILTLALGIGANSAVFSLLFAVVLRPLPYEDADQLVALWATKGGGSRSASYPNFHDWRAQNRVFEDIGSYRSIDHTVVHAGEPMRIEGARVSAGFFSVLRVRPAIGRAFLPREDLAGADNVVMLSDGLWKRCFGGDAEIIGRRLMIDGEQSTVVGVLPPGFDFPSELSAPEVWTPTSGDASLFSERSWGLLGAVARLKPGVALKQAQVEMDTIAGRLAQQYPDDNTGLGVGLGALHEQVVSGVRPALLVLFGIVGLVLLIACANVANLLLARGSGRTREFAIRAALGAGRRRLMGQVCTENLLLAIIGGVVGLVLACWSIEALLAFLPSDLPRANEIGINAEVLLFTLVASLLTGLIFGAFPAMIAARVDLQGSLRAGRRASTSRRRQRTRGGLVIAEVALALVPLMGAGLLARSFVRLTNVDAGFDPENLLSFRLAVPPTEDDDPRRRAAFHDRVIEHFGSLPGVEAVGASTSLPLAGFHIGLTFRVLGRPEPAPGEEPHARYDSVSAGYFRTMGIQLREGRVFAEKDERDGARVMVISESMARRYWPDEDPIGRLVEPSIAIDEGDEVEAFEIVGIVGDVRYRRLNAEAYPCMYVPHRQQTWSTMSFAARTSVDPAVVMRAVQGEIAAITTEEAPYELSTMDRRLAGSVGRQRFSMLLFGIFALLALTLASGGIYAVLSYEVMQRTHEIGVRMAIGAQRSDVLCQVLKQGFGLVAVGLGVGLLGSFALTRALSSQLYEISPVDPVTFIGVPAFLSAAALLACYIPARKATRVDPIVALRCE